MGIGLFSKIQTDAFSKLVYSGICRAVSSFDQNGDYAPVYRIPKVIIDDFGNIRKKWLKSTNQFHTSYKIGFCGEFTGIAEIIFPPHCELMLGQLLFGNVYNFILKNSSASCPLREVANILVNGMMGEISNLVGTHFEYHLISETGKNVFDHLTNRPWQNSLVLLCYSGFSICDINIEYKLIVVVEPAVFIKLIDSMEAVQLITNQ